MKSVYFLLFLFMVFITCPGSFINAQGGVGINYGGLPPDNSAGLDVNFNNKGLLMPRMSASERNAITNPATGLFIFNTDCDVINYNAGTPSSPNWATVNASNVLTAGVSIAASPVGAICTGTSVTFSATPSQNNLSPSYQWQVNGANVGTNSSAFTATSLNNGDVVSCILASSANCVTGSPATSNAITMLVNPVPAITGTTPAGFCRGNGVTLGASTNLGTINWYPDSTGGSSLSTGASFTVTGLNSSTTYYVDATANGCTTPSRTGVTATYYPNIPGQPGAISGPATENRDSSATYSVTPIPNVAAYVWTVSLGTVTSGQGTFSITVAWGDSSGAGNISVDANNTCGTGSAQSLPVSLETETFYYSGSLQTFTVPTGTTSVTIDAYGAAGGGGYSGAAGLGAEIEGTFAVNPGDVLNVMVGQQGLVDPNNGSGGGGGSFVWNASSLNLLIAAGGGGGGGVNSGVNGGNGSATTTPTGTSPNGTGAGAGGSGGSGGNGGGGQGYAGAGGGAGWNGNGSNGASGSNQPVAGGGGYSPLNGGAGGTPGVTWGAAGGYGGGGGAGISGGGGGGYNGGGGGNGWGDGSGSYNNGSGGGGGSYNGGTNQANNAGAETGDGMITISW